MSIDYNFDNFVEEAFNSRETILSDPREMDRVLHRLCMEANDRVRVYWREFDRNFFESRRVLDAAYEFIKSRKGRIEVLIENPEQVERLTYLARQGGNPLIGTEHFQIKIVPKNVSSMGLPSMAIMDDSGLLLGASSRQRVGSLSFNSHDTIYKFHAFFERLWFGSKDLLG